MEILQKNKRMTYRDIIKNAISELQFCRTTELDYFSKKYINARKKLETARDECNLLQKQKTRI